MSDQVAEEIKIQEFVKQLKMILMVVLVVGIMAVGYLLIERGKASKQEAAFTSLYQAERLEEDAVRADAEAVSKATNAKDTKAAKTLPKESFYEIAKNWSDDQRKDYISKLQTTQSEFPGTVASALATLRLANLSFHLGKLDEAQKSFEQVIASFKAPSDESLLFKALANEGLATVQETQKKFDEAFKTFETASQLPKNPLKPMALLGQARVLRAQGKGDQAKTFFDKVISEFPNSDYEKRARALKDLPHQG